MSRARELAKLGNQNLLKLDTDNTRVGIASTTPGFTLDVGSGKIRGDGSELIGISAGLGTALTTDQEKPDNLIYYTNRALQIDEDVTVDVPAGSDSKLAYTQYQDVVVTGTADLIVADGDDFVLDILGLEGLEPDGRL